MNFIQTQFTKICSSKILHYTINHGYITLECNFKISLWWNVLNNTVYISAMRDPKPRISFINNSPIVDGRNVTMHLAINYNVTSLQCRLIVPNKLQKEELEEFLDCECACMTILFVQLSINCYRSKINCFFIFTPIAINCYSYKKNFVHPLLFKPILPPSLNLME